MCRCAKAAVHGGITRHSAKENKGLWNLPLLSGTLNPTSFNVCVDCNVHRDNCACCSDELFKGKHLICGVCFQVGRPSDIWSLGCILYQIVYGHTPFSHLPFIQKMHAITDPTHTVSFPPVANPHLLNVMQRCLDRNPRTRITMQVCSAHPKALDALNHAACLTEVMRTFSHRGRPLSCLPAWLVSHDISEPIGWSKE